VRRFYLVLLLLLSGLLGAVSRAETYKLITGDSVVGEIMPSTANDIGLQVKVGEGEFQKVPWGNFGQDDLKKFSANPKLAGYVEPFIEITRQERAKQTEYPIRPVPHLERPVQQSIIGAFFSSGLGVFIMLIFYAANIYAGYEVAACRGRPRNLVCGVSAVVPFFGPLLFLCLPTKMLSLANEEEEEEEVPSGSASGDGAPSKTTTRSASAGLPAGSGAASVPAPTSATAAPVASAQEPPPPIKREHRKTPQKIAVPGAKTASAASAANPVVPMDDTSTFFRKDVPKPVVFQRGQFTFNRRFFETKFAGFMGVSPKDAAAGMVLVVKSLRGEYTGSRISKLTASEFVLQIDREQASEEVTIPFQEVREIVMKHSSEV
jgi:hypothetical protein